MIQEEVFHMLLMSCTSLRKFQAFVSEERPSIQCSRLPGLSKKEPLAPHRLHQIILSLLLLQIVLPGDLMDHLALEARLTLGALLLRNHQVLQGEFWKQSFACARSKQVMFMR